MSVNNRSNKIWCPRCEEYVDITSVNTAAKLVGLNVKTIYRYIGQGLLHAIRVGGRTVRVCTSCLSRRETHTRGITFRGVSAWCSRCNACVELLSVSDALKTAAVSNRTIYRYVAKGRVSSIKTVGKTIRVCAGCLLKRGYEN